MLSVSHLVIQAVGHRGAEVPQVGLHVGADDLLIKGVDLRATGGTGMSAGHRGEGWDMGIKEHGARGGRGQIDRQLQGPRDGGGEGKGK